MNTLRIFGFSLVTTIAIWVATAVGLGSTALWTVIFLSILEVAVSFDNAIVNARLLSYLSRFWQMLFLTVGIFIAVFVVRFTLPILIVSLTSGMGFMETVSMALNHPEEYGHRLEEAGPSINAFGATFLAMLAAGFFLDSAKHLHWLAPLEHRLSKLGRYDNVAIIVLLGAVIAIAVTMPGSVDQQFMVLAAGVLGIVINLALGVFDAAAVDEDEPEGGAIGPSTNNPVRLLVGGAAALMFLRLEVVDASFSMDGVIGAFAMSNNVVLIMAGLGVGSLWVRSLTIYFQRSGALIQFRYLEHGAYWAIVALAGIMFAKIYHLELPELVVGSIGLVVIGGALWSSISKRRKLRDAKKVSA